MVVIAFSLLIAVLLGSGVSLARRAGEVLGLPVIALMSFGFLYIVQPLYFMGTGELQFLLSEAQVTRAIAWPAIALACFMLGWRIPPSPPLPARTWPAARLWAFGLFSSLFGLAAYSVFVLRSGGFGGMYSMQHGAALDWNDNTAYLYMSPWWIIAGTATMILAACHVGGSRWRFAVPAVFTAALLVNAALMASRGFLFATAAATLSAVAIGKGWKVTLPKVAPAALAMGLGVLAMVGFRSVLYTGGIDAPAPEPAEALGRAMGSDVNSSVHRMTGNEFVVHAAVLDTVDATGKYHYGRNWLYVYLVHPIPRVLWPDKPYSFESSGIDGADISATTGVVVADGSAPGIVADLYANFGRYSLLFFWIFGAFARRLHERAVALSSPLSTIAYIMLLATGLNCFAQGFSAILVPYTYSLAPALIFAASQSIFVRQHSPALCRP
jgi:hypothetical protein